MKNYTSTAQAETSIADIERLLVAHKARDISKRYSPTGEVEALQFSIESPVPGGFPIWIMIPANVEGAFKVLRKRRKHATKANEQRDREQAKRTAWRLMLDWVHVQLSLIEMEQVQLLQVFLPYVWDETRQETLFAKIANNEFKALTYQPTKEE